MAKTKQMKKKEIDDMIKKHNVLLSIVNFFKRIFKINTKLLISDSNSVKPDRNDFRKDIKKEIGTTDKETTMFLYKQLRLGNINPEYIPNQYLVKIVALLNEEKNIRQKELNKINQEIAQNNKTY